MIAISRRAVLVGLVAFAVVAQLRGTLAADAPAAGGKRITLGGYDPVSYFTDGRPEKGSAAFTAAYDGATYWFKSAEHRALFVADPDRYAPQFNGFCAMSLARGEKVESDPQSWAIADGKLYVFGKTVGPAMFAEQRASTIEMATQNWREVRKIP
jgi:YHS domain-containing protein